MFKDGERIEISEYGIKMRIRQQKGSSQQGVIHSILGDIIRVRWDGTKYPDNVHKSFISKIKKRKRRTLTMKTYTMDDAKQRKFIEVTKRLPEELRKWCESEVKRIRQDPERKAILVMIVDKVGRKQFQVWASKIKKIQYIQPKKDCCYVMKNSRNMDR